nr:bifunctional oligoribonuclease/PAP phosphatase NrnA [Geomicrobium sediminis]
MYNRGEVTVQEKLLETIERFDTIIICRHVRPDPDAFGSQLGLAELIRENTTKMVYTVGEDERSLSFLATMDEVDTETFKDALVIICDTANRGRIDEERYALAKETFKVDHHPEIDDYADASWVDTSYSSTSEMITRWFEETAKPNGWKMNQTSARVLYAGIVGDTGRFRHPNTTEHTFRAAGVLMEQGIDLPELFRNLYRKPLPLLRLEGELLRTVSLSEYGVAAIRVSDEQLKQYEVTVNESSALVNAISDLEGLLTWGMFVEQEDGTYRVRLRSKGPIVNTIAEKHNGGGHPLAAGASANSKEEIDTIIAELNEAAKQFNPKTQ